MYHFTFFGGKLSQYVLLEPSDHNGVLQYNSQLIKIFRSIIVPNIGRPLVSKNDFLFGITIAHSECMLAAKQVSIDYV